MKLTAEQIRAVTVGATRVEEIDGTVHFFRFTEAQTDFYKGCNDDFYHKTYATAGVRLEFVTNSRTLSLTVEALTTPVASSRKFFAVAVYENGNKLGLIGSETTPCGVFEGGFALCEGESKICLYMPWSVVCTIRALTLDDGATITPVKKKCRMLQYGDSITHGYDAHEPQNSYASIVAHAFSADARNKGIGGEVFQPTLATLPDEGFAPDYITVAYGTNDWSHREREDMKTACRDFYHNLAALYPEAKIFAIAPIWREQENEYRVAGAFRDVVEIIGAAIADLPNVVLIDAYPFVPKEAACFSSDMLHPSDLGFRHYGERLVEALRPYIKK